MRRRRTVLTIGSTLLGMLAFAAPVRAASGVQSIGACRTIDKPGSYVLAKSLDTRAGDCLLITIGLVTIDLAGYTITGGGTGSGISNTSGTFDITVINGTVTNFENGVALQGRGHVVDGVRAVTNTGMGISLNSPSLGPGDNQVRNSNGSRNGTFGIVVSSVLGGATHGGDSVIGNVANGNGSGGIFVRCPSTVLNNVASQNGDPAVPTNQISDNGGCTRLGNSPAP